MLEANSRTSVATTTALMTNLPSPLSHAPKATSCPQNRKITGGELLSLGLISRRLRTALVFACHPTRPPHVLQHMIEQAPAWRASSGREAGRDQHGLAPLPAPGVTVRATGAWRS